MVKNYTYGQLMSKLKHILLLVKQLVTIQYLIFFFFEYSVGHESVNV